MILSDSSECVVYLDFYKKRGDGVYDVYVDFRFESDFYLFLDIGRNLRFNENNTYLELCNLKTKKRLRSGCYYKLNLELLHRFEPSPDYESLFIGLSYNLEEMLVPQEDSEELLQTHGPLYPSPLYCREPRWLRRCYYCPSEFELPPLGNSSLSVCVRDVGQANWNELRVGDRLWLNCMPIELKSLRYLTPERMSLSAISRFWFSLIGIWIIIIAYAIPISIRCGTVSVNSYVSMQ